jgi:hypothetical protein
MTARQVEPTFADAQAAVQGHRWGYGVHQPSVGSLNESTAHRGCLSQSGTQNSLIPQASQEWCLMILEAVAVVRADQWSRAHRARRCVVGPLLLPL